MALVSPSESLHELAVLPSETPFHHEPEDDAVCRWHLGVLFDM